MFIDGLNEAFVAHPVLHGTSVFGEVLGHFYGCHPIDLIGGILQTAAGVGSAAVSYDRTKMYLKAMNERLFHPAGLHANVLSTKKMLAHVEYPEEKFQSIHALESGMDIEQIRKNRALLESGRPDNPMITRMQRLEGHTLPLDYDVPKVIEPKNVFKKMENMHATRQAKKQEEKIKRALNKGDLKEQKRAKEGDKKGQKADEKARDKLSEVDGKMWDKQAKFERKMAGSKAAENEKEQEKL